MSFVTQYPSKTLTKNQTKNLVDPSWELIDPTPNIYNLFVAFNAEFFWSKLGSVSVSWSKKMTSCAGVCTYHGRGGLCVITLSEPLLKLRPRKDLVETLLHEMIHAFLFVTHNNKDRDGHGPEFHKHMWRINNEAGTNISVYHSFHDEVRLYQQHWWKCNGPCQHRQPFYGLVKRAMNRKPGPSDRWWAEHQRNCGGTFIKIKEPEKPKKAITSSNTKNKKENANPNGILKYFSPIKDNNAGLNKIHGFTLTLTSSSGAVVLNTDKVPSSPKNNLVPFSGHGNKISSSSSTNKNYDAVRNAWLNKYSQPTKRKSDDPTTSTSSPKTVKLDEMIPCEFCDRPFSISEVMKHSQQCGGLAPSKITHVEVQCDICDDLYPENEIEAHKASCLLNFSQAMDAAEYKFCEICLENIAEHLYETHVKDCNGENEGDDNLNTTVVLQQVECPICNLMYNVEIIESHADECFIKKMCG